MIKLTRIQGGVPIEPPLTTDKASLTLGRAPSSDLRFTEPEVSELHATITFDGWYCLKSLGRNGVHFLSRSIDRPDERGWRLRRGDRFSLGNPGPIIEVDFIYDREKYIAALNERGDDARGANGLLIIAVVFGVALLLLVGILAWATR